MMTKKGMFITMKTIKKGIVFSNDIQNILEGYNAITYNYNNNGIITPKKEFISLLRTDFAKTVNKIFANQTTIISEEDMQESISSSISDVLRRYPHSLLRQNLSINR